MPFRDIFSSTIKAQIENPQMTATWLFAGYPFDHELAIAIAKAGYDDLVGRSMSECLLPKSRGDHSRFGGGSPAA